MARVYVSVGSNIDRERNIRRAVMRLKERFGDLHLSPVYRSRPVGFRGEDFYNLVARFDTSASPHALDDELTIMEYAFGRRSDFCRYGPRALDIDLLLYDDLVIKDDDLELPRRDILEYAFVLRPLSDLAPELRHPVVGRSVADLWANFDSKDQTLWLAGLTQGLGETER